MKCYLMRTRNDKSKLVAYLAPLRSLDMETTLPRWL
jgi:hypothetical protein